MVLLQLTVKLTLDFGIISIIPVKPAKSGKVFTCPKERLPRALPPEKKRTYTTFLDEINTHQRFLHLSLQVRNPTASAAGQDRSSRHRPLPDRWRPADTHRHS